MARALDAVRVLASADEIGLVDVARRLDLPASTTHRLLATLSAQGWVAQNPRTGRYRISRRVLWLAAQLHERTAPLRATARPYLERARKVSGAVAQLAVLEDAEVVYLEEICPPAAAAVPAGRTAPAHAAAAGKVLLAQVAPDRLAILRSPHEYERRTARTITTPAALERELEAIRRRGYAVDDEEDAAGVAAVAAAVVTATGAPVAAVGIAGAAAVVTATG
ncbi:MAG TPA: IclR family transcriptional regulator C-terminal domain-containing protein, partial [Solirubrobacteraceae bacterium]|nr:IclR family transcriptional regulator C-terminal domain-containing protein [Solirubrobacteraceae bacterium]